MSDDRSPHIARFFGGAINPNSYDNEPTKKLMASGRAEGGAIVPPNYMPAAPDSGKNRAEGGAIDSPNYMPAAGHAEGGAAKVRKGMMTQNGRSIDRE